MKKELIHKEIIRNMTTEEKISLLSGRDIWSTKPVRRLHIPAMYLSDGPHLQVYGKYPPRCILVYYSLPADHGFCGGSPGLL